ncbi:three-helix bundle dimerization domain-containing protein [Actinomadura flavalba]|uniref:three-helix bundle dimerization domain-containing protein n=1 Tax=Actinomadura flavalba TaxID=1120938 RepID=UPI00037B482B|nr:hypothetical protein [Actinomadura flavalba]
MPVLVHRRDENADAVVRRLADEFLYVPPEAVDRCVADVRARAIHLGLEDTPVLVERMAREHLVGRVKSEPPSGKVR